MMRFDQKPTDKSAVKDPWKNCTAEGARRSVNELFRSLSFREKVIWLEEAEKIARRFRIKDSSKT